MKQRWNIGASVGALLLGYSALLAPWLDERAAPQLLRDLGTALQYHGATAPVGLWPAALVGLYLLGAVQGVLAWRCRAGRAAAGAGALAAGVAGALVAGWLLSLGAAWEGAFSAVLGYLLVGVACYGEARLQAPTEAQARRKAAARWRARARAAREAGAPVTVAVCRDLVPLTADDRQRLAAQMRARDEVLFFARGAVFWLENTPCEGAREAVERLRKRFPQRGAACCGLACAVGEAADVTALTAQAARAQAFAEVVGAAVLPADEARLPEALRAPAGQAPPDPALLHTAAATWNAHARPRQALVIHFAPADLGAALEAEAQRTLRTGDHVLPLTPHRLLVLLPSTDAVGGAQVQMRLRQHLAAFAGVANGVVAVYRLAGAAFPKGEALVQAALRLPESIPEAADAIS